MNIINVMCRMCRMCSLGLNLLIESVTSDYRNPLKSTDDAFIMNIAIHIIYNEYLIYSFLCAYMLHDNSL